MKDGSAQLCHHNYCMCAKRLTPVCLHSCLAIGRGGAPFSLLSVIVATVTGLALFTKCLGWGLTPESFL